jgi:hypothetical protein
MALLFLYLWFNTSSQTMASKTEWLISLNDLPWSHTTFTP